eukprot:s237_g10.t1
MQDVTKFEKYIVDAASLYDIPSSIDLRTNYVLDDSAPRSELGLGVSAIELSVGHQRNRDIGKKAEAMDPSEAEPAGALPPAPVDDSLASHTQPSSARASTPRVLQAQNSEDSSDAKAMELIAQNCKAAFDRGLWSSPDPLNSSNVTFWMIKYKEHILQDFKDKSIDAEAYVKQLDPHSAMLLKFVEFPFKEIRAFATVFSELNKVVPGMIPTLGLAICKLAEFEMTGSGELQISLSLAQQTMFYKSQLYASFLRERWMVRFEYAKGNDKASENDRCSEAKMLLKDENMCNEKKAELETITTLFGSADNSTKLLFLLEDLNRFEILKAWHLSHKWCQLLPFAEKGFVWKGATSSQFLEGAWSLSESKALAAVVPNPVVKHLLSCLWKARQVLPELPDEKQGACERLLKGAFLEVPLDELKDVSPMLLAKLASSFSSKDLQLPTDAMTFLKEMADQAPKDPEKEKKEKKDKKEKKEKKDKKEKKENESETPGAGSGDAEKQTPSIEFQIGDIVLTKAMKNKNSYDGKEARVEGILTGHLKCLILSGPAKGESKKFSKDMCVPKASAAPGADTADPKRRKVEKANKATELFGNVDLP